MQQRPMCGYRTADGIGRVVLLVQSEEAIERAKCVERVILRHNALRYWLSHRGQSPTRQTPKVVALRRNFDNGRCTYSHG